MLWLVLLFHIWLVWHTYPVNSLFQTVLPFRFMFGNWVAKNRWYAEPSYRLYQYNSLFVSKACMTACYLLDGLRDVIHEKFDDYSSIIDFSKIFSCSLFYGCTWSYCKNHCWLGFSGHYVGHFTVHVELTRLHTHLWWLCTTLDCCVVAGGLLLRSAALLSRWLHLWSVIRNL